jgi:hypothetical protein
MKPSSTPSRFKNSLSKYSIVTLFGLVLFAAMVFVANPFNPTTATGNTPSVAATAPIAANNGGQTTSSGIRPCA